MLGLAALFLLPWCAVCIGRRAEGEQQGQGLCQTSTLALPAERRFRPKLLLWSPPMMGRS